MIQRINKFLKQKDLYGDVFLFIMIVVAAILIVINT